MTTANTTVTDSDHEDGEAAEAPGATVTQLRPEPVGAAESYEPWLFQTLLRELSANELGVGFIYTLLEMVADRHQLRDVVVVLSNEAFGTQMFRLGGRPVTADLAERLSHSPGVFCDPECVSPEEGEAVRTACELVFSLHRNRFGALHDPLTNIANRRSFDIALDEAAARSARYGWAFTLVLVDLNDFKVVNDRLGHEHGDLVLRQFGMALRRAVRQGDTAARIGGDEFAVILSNAEGTEAIGFVERLRSNLAVASVDIDFTVGTASSPRDSTDPGELMRMSDTRLYEKKGMRR